KARETSSKRADGAQCRNRRLALSRAKQPSFTAWPNLWRCGKGHVPAWHTSCSVGVRRHCGSAAGALTSTRGPRRGESMNGIIYLIGLIVVILAILSFVGLR